jgi:hypothetical protein
MTSFGPKLDLTERMRFASQTCIKALRAHETRDGAQGVPAMSAGPDFARIRNSSVVEVISAIPLQSFNPTAMSRLEGRPIVRSPEQVRLHRALEELGWTGVIDEFNDAARLKDQSVPEPILVTANGTILAGFGRWRLAVFDPRQEINCIEYPLSEDEALQFIISHHQPQRGRNSFIRVRLALKLEPNLRQRALDNMRAGGKYKGSANLPEPQRIDVREEIAEIAGVSARHVANVKTILEVAHPRLIEALQNSTLTINRAIQFCKLPRAEQLEQFIQYCEERATNKVIRRSIAAAQPLSVGLGQSPRCIDQRRSGPHQSCSRSDHRQMRLGLRTPMLHRRQQLRIGKMIGWMPGRWLGWRGSATLPDQAHVARMRHHHFAPQLAQQPLLI